MSFPPEILVDLLGRDGIPHPKTKGWLTWNSQEKVVWTDLHDFGEPSRWRNSWNFNSGWFYSVGYTVGNIDGYFVGKCVGFGIPFIEGKWNRMQGRFTGKTLSLISLGIQSPSQNSNGTSILCWGLDTLIIIWAYDWIPLGIETGRNIGFHDGLDQDSLGKIAGRWW